MAVKREHPYGRFNFVVDLGTGSTDGPDAGFQSCSPIAMELAVTEYRNGNDKENAPRKVTGLTRVRDVTLRRGIIGSLALYQWFDQIRNGDHGAVRTVAIHLQNEDRTAVVMTWRLRRARSVRHVSGPLDARGEDVAVEEITLACERLEIE